ncbi:MAG: hypothetical protein ACD_19C00426G0060 [uncultured bacterium]|nr:MAG: hypothetical protein ACD_19C00426G0060 [uncultured bacterium]
MAKRTVFRNSIGIGVGDVLNVKNGDHEGFIKDSTNQMAGENIDKRIAQLSRDARGGVIDYEGLEPKYEVETDTCTIAVPKTIFFGLFNRGEKKG